VFLWRQVYSQIWYGVKEPEKKVIWGKKERKKTRGEGAHVKHFSVLAHCLA